MNDKLSYKDRNGNIYHANRIVPCGIIIVESRVFNSIHEWVTFCETIKESKIPTIDELNLMIEKKSENYFDSLHNNNSNSDFDWYLDSE